MGNYYYDVYVLCPFYIKGASQHIECEGLLGTSSVKLKFSDEEQRKRYSRKYCECDYESCELCNILQRKYEVIEDGRTIQNK